MENHFLLPGPNGFPQVDLTRPGYHVGGSLSSCSTWMEATKTWWIFALSHCCTHGFMRLNQLPCSEPLSHTLFSAKKAVNGIFCFGTYKKGI